MRPTLFLLDANALLHRSWHAIRPLTSPDGRIVNCVYGMMMSVFKLLEDEKPDAFVACWDTEAPTFRHEAYTEYKAHRKEKEQELYDQIPWVKEGFASMGIESLALDGYEADDLLGTIAKQASDAGWNVTIITGDRDSLQLIAPHVSVRLFVKGVTETKLMNAETLLEEYGVTPKQFIDLKAIQGDTSDNIPGIRGIGEVGARSLMKHFGSLKKIIEAAHDPSSEMRAKIRHALLEQEQEIPALLDLVTIRHDAPITWNEKSIDLQHHEEKARAFLLTYGFVSLLKKLDALLGKSDEASTKKKSSKSLKAYNAMHQATLDTMPSQNQLTTFSSVKELIMRLENAEFFSVAVVWEDPGLSPVKAKPMAFAVSDGEVAALLQLHEIKNETLFFSRLGARAVAHDTKEVMHACASLGIESPIFIFDIMLAAYIINAGERSHDLRTVAQAYLAKTLPTEPTIADQVFTVHALKAPLEKALKQDKLESILERFELPLAGVLMRMEREGIMIDTSFLQDLSRELTKEQKRLLDRMHAIAGTELNPLSPQQLSHVLFEVLGLPTDGIKKGKTGYSTAASELEKLRGKHEIIELIEDYREVSKLLSTYVDVIPTLVDKHQRLHTTFQQAVAATGRLSSADPNVQNIPIRTEMGRRVREAFIAKEGFELLSCDYSQIELRLIAALAQDTSMIEAFEKGLDIHTATASRIWNTSLTEVTKDQRRAAKAINFGIIYGQGPVGLAQTAGITFAEAKTFIANYFAAYPGIKRYLDDTKSLAKKQGFIETIYGRRRPLPELESSLPMMRAMGERMAINMPVQGTAADMIKLAMIEIDRGLSAVCKEARLLLQVHDELVFEVPSDQLMLVAEYAKRVMEGVSQVGVPIVVEAKYGKNWENMKSVC